MRSVIVCLLLLISPIVALSAANQYSTSRISPKQIEARGDSLYERALEAYSAKDYAKALRDCESSIKLYEQSIGTSTSKYALTLYVASLLHHFNGNIDAAISTGAESKELIARSFGRSSSSYVTALTSLALSYSDGRQFDRAIETQRELVNILRDTPKSFSAYIDALGSLGDFYHTAGQYRQAIDTRLQCLAECSMLPNNETKKAEIIADLAVEYYYAGDYSKAIKRGKEAVNATKHISGEKSQQYVTALNNLANFYSAEDNYEEALKIHKRCLSLTEAIYGSNSPKCATVLSTLAGSYSRLGNTTDAIATNQKALDLLQFSDNSTLKIYTLINHVNYLIDLGNYDEAEIFSAKALSAAEEKFGHLHPQTAKAMSKQALAKYYSGKIAEAIEIETEVVAIIKATLGQKHSQYVEALSSLAAYHSQAKKFEKAIELTTEALTTQEEIYGKDNVMYAVVLSNLAIEMSQTGKNAEAAKMDKDAAAIFAKITHTRHPDYGSMVSNTAVHSFAANDYDTFIKAANEFSQLATDIVSQTFADLTSDERNLFWSRYSNWFIRFMPKASCGMPTKEVISNAYDCTLFAKGLLLNSEIEMRQLIAESGDSSMLSLYEEMQAGRRWLNRLYEKPASEREYSTDSIERIVAETERQLVAKSKVYGDFTRNLRITWKDVRQQLGRNDIAIEFVSFPVSSDSTTYAAYILKKDYSEPKLQIFKDIPDGKALKTMNIYTSATLSQNIWGALSPHLGDVKNIYFAPSGQLYNIAIESLPHWENPEGLVSDYWEIHRLSSTRQLAISRKKEEIANGAVFGGLYYDTDTSTIINNSLRYKHHSRSVNPINSQELVELRSGVNYLPATLSEAQQIANLISNKTATELYTDTLGTESTFKALSGGRKNLLHIATHGFYWTERELRRMDDTSFLGYENFSRRSDAEDKALSRSGLLLSGANIVLTGNKLPEGVDDGILTAREIAQLDFKGLELVVLSACQTAMGEVTGEGVFGLQRGFKKAGAEAILMSLWKVDDRATSKLMTEFYQHWATGASIHQSLEHAKKVLRSHPEFNDPTYWAAFILLDAFN